MSEDSGAASDVEDTALEEGETLPDVEALLCDGEVFTPRRLDECLGDRGLLLSFYGFCFSAPATNWWRRYERYGWQEFPGVPVVGVCRDGPYAVNAFLRELDSPFHVYSDVDAEIAEAFGLLRQRDDMPNASTANRAVYVFDSSGEARYRWLADDDISPQDVDAVEAAVEEL